MKRMREIFAKPGGRSRSMRYGIAAGAALAALAISLIMRPLSHAAESPLFVAAVMLSAWLGGMGPALVATAVAALGLDAVMAPTRLAFAADEAIVTRLTVFLLVALLTSGLDAARRRAEVERANALARERAARADAEAANRRKDEFVTVVAHELRTPLTAIVGWSAALERGQLDAPTRARALHAIRRNALLQARLIDDLVDLSRVARGRLSLHTAPVDLCTVIEAAVDGIPMAAAARGIRLAVDLRRECPVVAGDAARLQQAVSNLLANAIKHSSAAGTVGVRLDVVGAHARIDVRDEGCGIAPDLLPHVFEPYWQAEGQGAPSGLGLGRAIVRDIVERHGGRVEATSRGIGHGACFSMLLPFDRAPSERPAPAAGAARDSG
jgi:signal transduction histidine kinase